MNIQKTVDDLRFIAHIQEDANSPTLRTAARIIDRLREQLDDSRHALELEKSEIAGRDQDIDVLKAVMDAVEPFLAEVPEDMSNKEGFNQYTTAGDCRELNAAFRKALEAHPC